MSHEADTQNTSLLPPPRDGCPSDATLQQLLDGTLPVDDQPTLESHVQTCAHCQRALDRLTAFATAAWLPDGERPVGPAPKPVVPNYELVEEIGRGGYGVVYRATDGRLGRAVAVKVLKHGALADAADRQRFLTEARAAARLAHPHIVPVFEVGEADGVPYIVMEHAAGGPLSRRLDGTPLAARSAAELVETVARAVEYAHSQGVVHRDLKPGNILLSPQSAVPSPQSEENRLGTGDWGLGTPKVADFGTARLLDTPGELTPTQAVLGTPSYMAPEQAGGASRQVGPAADVYSLGAILYELLTGRPPFKAATPFETLLLVRQTDPVPVRRLNPAVPRDLETVALKCLEKDPGRRYASAGALADDLRRWLDGKPILARPVGPVERFARWAARHPTVAALSVALVVFVLGALVAVTVLWRRSVEQAELAERRGRQARENLGLATESLDRTTRLVMTLRGRKGTISRTEAETLDEVLALYDRRLADPDVDPATRKRAADALEQVAGLYWATGDYPRSDRLRGRAIHILEGLAAEFPDEPAYRYEIAKHLTGLELSDTLGTYHTKADYLRRSVALLAEVRRTDPNRYEWAVQHANNLYLLAMCVGNAGDEPAARAWFDEVRAICRAVLARTPDDFIARLIDVQAVVYHGFLRARATGDWEGGYQASRAGFEFFRWHWQNRQKELEGLDSTTGHFHTGADFLWRQGKRAEAADLLRAGVTELRPVTETYPRLAGVRRIYFVTAWRLADVLWQTDRPRAAAAYADARKAADDLLAQRAVPGHVAFEVAVFLSRCPVAPHRDPVLAARPDLFASVPSQPIEHGLHLIAAGRPADARDLIRRERPRLPATVDAGYRNRFDLVEVLAVAKAGDIAEARRLFDAAKAYTGHDWERAVEHDLLRREVEEALGKGR